MNAPGDAVGDQAGRSCAQALGSEGFSVRAMTGDDLDLVVAIEQRAYPYPWSRGNFSDSLSSGYDAWIFADERGWIGYAVLMWVIDEAHLLNLCVPVELQRRGLGRRLLGWLMADAAARGARSLLLEVRPSNLPALALYRNSGFAAIGVRKAYYPAGAAREDALVMSRSLGNG